MKRVAPEMDRETKRQHLEESTGESTAVLVFMDASQKENARDLVDYAKGEPVYIAGKVQMEWNSGSTARVMMEATPSERLEIRFTQKQGNSTGKTIPVVLTYDEGVALEISGAGPKPGSNISMSTKPEPSPTLVSPEQASPVVSVPSVAHPVAKSVVQLQQAHLPSVASTRQGILPGEPPRGFTPLREATEKPEGSLCSVFGAVKSFSKAKQSSNGNWFCSFRIVDATNYCQDEFPPADEGFRVNCFTKEYKERVPDAKEGDVLILKGIKISEFGGKATAVGLQDKLKWAVYSNRKMGHGGSAGVPQPMDKGVRLNPFYEPDHADVAHCMKLADWWHGVVEERAEARAKIEKTAGTALRVSKQTQREHILLQDLGNTELSNYIDCTVQVLAGFENGRDTLYVTDYTVVSEGKPCAAGWCPLSLAGFVLPIKMWDAAKQRGSTMKAGEFYLLRNVRKGSWDGYVEGKLVEDKIHRLDLGDAERWPPLEALLERMNNHEIAQT